MTKHLRIVDLSNTKEAYFAPAAVTAPGTQLVHVSGQVGITKSGHVPSDYESQIHLALFNLRRILIAAGASVKDLAKVTFYIVDYDVANRKHVRPLTRFYGQHRPAQTMAPVPKLAHPSWLFEIDALIAVPDPKPAIPRSLTVAEREVDVVIVGAGLAGLSAARDLTQTGLSVLVIEARDRVGGRTYSLGMPDGSPGIIEAGAGWINDVNQTRMINLVREFGLETIEQNTQGECSLQNLDGEIFPFPYGEVPKQFGPSTVADVVRIRDGAEADCHKLSIFQPTDTELDAITFQAYLESKNASQEAIWTATIWTRAMLGIDPRDVSALFFLNYCKSGGGLLNMRSDREGGGQHLRIRQGTQTVSKKLADTLPPQSIQLSTLVKQITQNGPQNISVTAADGRTINGRKVIISVPSPVLKHIKFQPALHPAKLAWSEAAGYGYYAKAMMVFRTHFWVPKGFCGLAQSFIGPAAVIRDSCSPADKTAVLTCFMGGPPAQEWSKLPRTTRIEQILDQLGELFDAKEQVNDEFQEMICYEWPEDEYAGFGCPCAHLPPGVLDSLGPDALRQPTGDLHFAGTETSGEWKGYMEGAVLSGERAAKEVVAGLKTGALSRL